MNNESIPDGFCKIVSTDPNPDNNSLEVAIEICSKPKIAECLRNRKTPIPPAISHKLADYLADRTLRNTGPKPVTFQALNLSVAFSRKTMTDQMARNAARVYLALCDNRELAAHLLGMKAFEIASFPQINIIYDPLPPPPYVWKYSYMERGRNPRYLPTKGEIEDYVRKINEIGEKAFEKGLAFATREIVDQYLRCLQACPGNELPSEEMKQSIYQWIGQNLRIPISAVDKIIKREMRKRQKS